MFKDKEIIELLENIYKELKQITRKLKSNELRDIATKLNKGEQKVNG